MTDQVAPLAVVLAAGLGTRMRSRRPKVLHPLCGRPMLAHVLDVASAIGAGRPLVVVSPSTEATREAFAGVADFAVQAQPLGTADAVRAAMRVTRPDVAEVVVLSGDVPLLSPSTVASLVALRRSRDAAIALAVTRPEPPDGYGRVVRDEGGDVARVVEEKDAGPEVRATGEANAGLYAFDAAWLRTRVDAVRPSPATGEYYLTDLVALARSDGRAVLALDVPDALELAGINDRVQLAVAEGEMRRRILRRHMLAGVTVVDPPTAFVDATVELAPDVVLEPSVVLRGRTRVGAASVIGTGTQVIDSVVGERCRIWASVLESSEVEDDVQIGPFSHLRPGSSIGRGARLGNYAEVKNSRLGPGVQQHHVSYLGDATVGARTNVGAGTITANYDGARKLPTTIGEGAFLGVDTMLVAPVRVGEAAKTGAGAVVTHDVPDGMLAVGVPARLRHPRPRPPADDAAPGVASEPAVEDARGT